MKDILFDEVQKLLDSGKEPKEIFNWVGFDYNGVKRVKLNGKWNYIDENNKILSTQWFDNCWNFSEGFAIVTLKDKYNLIKPDGSLVSDIWFDYAYTPQDGLKNLLLGWFPYCLDKNGKLTKRDIKF